MIDRQYALAHELARAIWNKKYALLSVVFKRNIYQTAIRSPPNSMELSLNDDAGVFPNQPTVLDAAARLGNLSLNINEAIVDD